MRVKIKSIPFHTVCRSSLAALGAALLFGLPPASVLACSQTGKLAGLMHYAGSGRGDTPATLDEDPAVQARLQRLPASVRAHLKRKLDAQGPVDLVSCHLVLSGNADHMGGEENAILDVNLYSGAVTVAILSRGQITIYMDQDPTAGSGYDNAVPTAVRWWAVMASNRFRSVERPPPNTQVLKPR